MDEDRLLTLFHRAVECPPQERDAFLAHECDGDPQLLSDLRRLIENDSHADAAEFIDRPAVDVEARAAVHDLASQTGALFARYRIESLIGAGGMGAASSAGEAVVVVATISAGAHSGRGECVPYARYGESVESVVRAIEDCADPLAQDLDREELRALLPPGAARNAASVVRQSLTTMTMENAVTPSGAKRSRGASSSVAT